MVFGEVLGLKIQDHLDAEQPASTSATIEALPPMTEREAFRMFGLYGEIPGSSCEPIRVESWARSE
jgi:hypothetical protein